MTSLYITFGVLIAVMIIMAMLLLSGKGAFLISGYNTLSKGEKAKYDEKALCRFNGRLLLVFSLCMAFFPASIYFGMTWLTYCGIAIILLGAVFAVIYTNTSSRFRRKVDQVSGAGDDAPLPLASRTKIIITAVVSLVTLIAAGILLYLGGKDPVVSFNDNGIQIKAMYGLTVDPSEVVRISLLENSMKEIGPGWRKNGYGGMGATLKGHFKSDRIGETLLFVQLMSSPTIRIERAREKDIYISFRDPEMTRTVFSELLSVK